MSETITDRGQAVQLRAAEVAAEQQLERAEAPAYVDTTDRTAPARRPIIPVHLHRKNLRGTVGYAAGLTWHRTRYHGIRSPFYAIATLWHAVRGAGRLTGRLMHWWHWTEGWQLESQAVAAGRPGHHEAMRAHTQGLKTRSSRGRIVAACTVVVMLAAGALALVLPWWAWPVIGLPLVLVLARHGRPEGRQVIRAAVVAPTYQAPTPEVITRALGSLGLAGINEAIRSGEGIRFVSDVHRDGDGWGCDLDLPHGVTAGMILARREQLASGLRRPLSATWPEPVPHEHEGRLTRSGPRLIRMQGKRAIWARVSTDEQDAGNQLAELRQWAGRRGLEVVTEYVLDGASAWKGEHRDQLRQALDDARAGRYELLLVWALDRLSREGIEATLSVMRQFADRGVAVWSLKESWTETSDPHIKELISAIMAWVARMESQRRSDRVKAGLDRRKAQGLPIGRQPGATDRKPRRRSGYVAEQERRRERKLVS